MRKAALLVSVALVASVTWAGLGSAKKTNELKPGMTTKQVRELLGDPKQTQFVAGRLIWKYSLHQTWKGWIPYYLVFEKDTKQLQEWYADEAEYQRTQELWLKALPPEQKHDVTIRAE